MEIKAGDYVRNCYGRIAKIEYIEDNTAYCDNWLTQQYEDHIDFICLDNEEDLDEIIKSSPNIIDLVEVGDVIRYKDEYGNVLIRDVHNSVVMYDIKFKNIEVLSIVTKEQFSSMEYKIHD